MMTTLNVQRLELRLYDDSQTIMSSVYEKHFKTLDILSDFFNLSARHFMSHIGHAQQVEATTIKRAVVGKQDGP